MTPREKAKQLIESFAPHARLIANPGEAVGREKHSRQCATIAVEELIIEASDKLTRAGRIGLSNKEYWIQVKKEIEKL